MKVLQLENDETFIYELDPTGKMRWSLGIHVPDPPESQEPASREEVEWIASKIVQALDGKDFNSWGCHCDLESMPEGFEPDGCVIDEGRRQDCIYATGKNRVERKEDCKYWRRI